MDASQLIWNRLYREGASGFTFPEALNAAKQECINEIRLDAKEGNEPSGSISLYRTALERAERDYERIVEAARIAAEQQVVAEWLTSGDEELTRIAEVLRDGDYERLVF